MDLIEIVEKENFFEVVYTKTEILKEIVTQLPRSIEVRYDDHFRVNDNQIRRAARRKGISSRTYNAYEEKAIQIYGAPRKAIIRLFTLPKGLAKKEDKIITQIGYDALWELSEP